MNDLTFPFNNVPAHVRNVKSKAMEAMASGLTGGGFGNRISLRNSKFRFVQGGVDVGVHNEPHLDVVVFALANAVQRLYYENEYESNTKARPDCWSHDGKTPAAEVTNKQSPQCATCKQNIKGSGRKGNTKACAYKKRVVVLAPDDLEGAAYALDVSGQSMFGEQIEGQNRFSFKGYFEKLTAHGVSIDGIVTRLIFDDDASVPKLHFSPIRALTQEEYTQVQQRVDDPEVQKMLKDLTNEVEVDTFESAAPAIPAPPPKPQVVKQKEPEPEIVHKGVGGLVEATPKKKGFGGAAQQPVVDQTTTAAPKKSVTLDLDALQNFDDN